MDSYDWDLIKLVGGFILIIVVIFGGVFWMSRVECIKTASLMEMNYEWKVLGGCFIEVEPEKWIPLDSYRWIGDQSE